MKLRLILAFAAMYAGTCAMAYAQGAATPAPPASPSVEAVSAPADAAYVIGPEDILQINVWKEPDISATVPVRPDGKISLSLLDDVQAAGLTPVQLATDITQKLKRFIASPHVTIIVTAMNSRRAYIMGQVNRQGAILLISNMTVLQAISSAGGPTPFANLKKIYILRTETGKQLKLPFNYNEVIKGRNMAQNIYLRPGDTVVVP